MVKLQLFPPVVLQKTVFVPLAKNEPDGGVLVTAPQLPVAVTVKNTVAPHWFGDVETTMFVGHTIVQGPEGDAHAENSEVLPFVSVAVAVKLAKSDGFGSVTAKLALQPAPVVTLVEPRKTWPCPKPLGSQEGLAKNSNR
jgi:hypothetical protein